MKLSSSDRKALVNLAGTLPKGSKERRAILTGLKTAGEPLAYIWDGVDGLLNPSFHKKLLQVNPSLSNKLVNSVNRKRSKKDLQPVVAEDLEVEATLDLTTWYPNTGTPEGTIEVYQEILDTENYLGLLGVVYLELLTRVEGVETFVTLKIGEQKRGTLTLKPSNRAFDKTLKEILSYVDKRLSVSKIRKGLKEKIESMSRYL
jgi:hypothetical protein